MESQVLFMLSLLMVLVLNQSHTFPYVFLFQSFWLCLCTTRYVTIHGVEISEVRWTCYLSRYLLLLSWPVSCWHYWCLCLHCFNSYAVEWMRMLLAPVLNSYLLPLTLLLLMMHLFCLLVFASSLLILGRLAFKSH